MRTNWAGNVTFSAARLHRPDSVGALQRLVAGSERIRAVGTAHSFSTVADMRGDLVSVAGLPPVIEIDSARAAVRVSAAIRYGELAAPLHGAGHALPNLASLPGMAEAPG